MPAPISLSPTFCNRTVITRIRFQFTQPHLITIIIMILIQSQAANGQQGNNNTSVEDAPAVVAATPGCPPGGPTYNISRNTSATGTDLWCYECEELYKTTYDVNTSPCLNNLSQITIRQCSAADRYCKIDRLKLADQVMSIERGCSNKCPYGCRYNGYGLQYERCYSCCNTYGCNDGNGASKTSMSCSSALLFLIAYMSIQHP